LVYAGQRPIVCLAWGSAAWKVACRDRFVGWTHTLREQNLYPVVNNTRFLILPFVRAAGTPGATPHNPGLATTAGTS
jgi:hypothetical protein